MKYVIVDIDGTISKVGDRVKHLKESPCNWDAFYERCDEDEPIEPVLDLVDKLSKSYNIVYLTGRRESCREKTVNWLISNGMQMYSSLVLSQRTLYMRKDGDFRHDTEVKPELLKSVFVNHNIENFNIAFILEDRNSMVKKWRELGYTCLQVADGDF